MHPGILSAIIENWGHWPWPSRSFCPFDLEFLEILLVCMITCNGFQLESPNLYQICILGYSQLVLKMAVIDLDLQCHLAIVLTKKKTTFNVPLVYWARPAKGCYMSQTCSCHIMWYILEWLMDGLVFVDRIVASLVWFHRMFGILLLMFS